MLEPDVRYQLIYTRNLTFQHNEPLLKRLRDSYAALEIPYLDVPGLSEQSREMLDTYFYVPASKEGSEIMASLQRLHRSLGAIQLGEVWGREVLSLIETSAVSERPSELVEGGRYRITRGPWRNLQFKLTGVDANGDRVVGEFDLLETHEIDVRAAEIELMENAVDSMAGFRDVQEDEFKQGRRSAVIVDGSYALHRGMYGNAKLYTKSRRFVGGCSGYYYELLRLRELYPDSELYVVFDGYDRVKHAENPEYKATRAKATPQWQTAYADNLKWCRRLTEALGFFLIQFPEAEGDDVVASLATLLARRLDYERVVISAADNDFHQLVDDRIHQLLPKPSFRGYPERLSGDDAARKFGVERRDQINWVRAFAGDDSDNLPSINKWLKSRDLPARHQRDQYLPLIRAAGTREEVESAIATSDKFAGFLPQWRDNMRLLELRIDLMANFDAVDLARYRRPFNRDDLEKLLREVSFFRELESLARVERIFKSLW